MKKIAVFFFVFAMLFSFVSPQKAEASFFANFSLPQGLRVKVDPVIKDSSIDLYFSSLFLVRKLSYELTYEHKDGKEGITGQIGTGSKWVVKNSITLGTCSGQNCKYHEDIHNMKLKMTTDYFLFNTREEKTYTLIP